MWINYFNKKSSVPVPFNVLEHFVWLLAKFINCVSSTKPSTEDSVELQKTPKEDKDRTELQKKEQEYNELMLELRKRYIANKIKGLKLDRKP